MSLAVHSTFAAVLLLWPHGPIGKTPSAYEQLIKGKESQIVFYKFKDKLPDVKPMQKSDSRPPRAEVKILKQQIVSSPKNAPKATQMVWTPAPELKLTKETPSPNILALKVPPPPKIQPKKYTPPEVRKTARELPTVKPVDAPQSLVAKATPDPLINLGAAPKLTLANRPRFTAPEVRAPARSAANVPDMPSAPALASEGSPDSAPAVDAALQSALANVAVVGLNPSDKNVLPEGSRAAQFSAGPKLNPDGGTGGDRGASLSVPDLFVKGGGAEAKPTMMARMVAPTSPEALRGMSKYSGPTREAAPTRPSGAAAHVTNAPNPRFEGREVYSMAIQMPNITSYVGSWLMWYSDRNSAVREGPVSPPVPHRKVDPKYIATAAEERIEGRVQLMCVIRNNGKVDQVELVHGIDDRLNQSAMEALAKWEFAPATRGGTPVDVDVMVEIPFRLAPRLPQPK